MIALTLRRALTTSAVVGVLLAATACSDDSSAERAPTTTASSSAPASGEPPRSASANPSGSDRSTPMDIRVTIDGQEVEATLNDSPAARDLASLLPLTLDLEDFHGTERSPIRRGS
nr:cyclophilin-like fold protein [Streptomyces tardus]